MDNGAPRWDMEDDLLKILAGDSPEKYQSLGLNGDLHEALQRGDLQTVVLGMLLEQNPDPLLSTVMQFMLARDRPAVRGAAGHEEAKVPPTSRGGPADLAAPGAENGRPDARAALRQVALVLGACPACCGEQASCPKCRGSGGPGSIPSIASAHALRAWLAPALGRMGMHISYPALSGQ